MLGAPDLQAARTGRDRRTALGVTGTWTSTVDLHCLLKHLGKGAGAWWLVRGGI